MYTAYTHFTVSSAESSVNLQEKIEVVGMVWRNRKQKSSRERDLSRLLR